MSLEMVSEPVCYVHCNYCNTMLAVSVPSSSLFTIVTVRCGHCANLLSVDMNNIEGSTNSLQLDPLQDPQKVNVNYEDTSSGSGSSSKGNKIAPFDHSHVKHQPPRMPPIPPPEKRQRVPSAYNRFIKEEIQRIKASNPEISHREAFSTAAKNWAHFPHIHFGLNVDGSKHAKLDQPGDKKANGYYEINETK